MPIPDSNSAQLGAYRAPTLEEERARLIEPIKDFRKQIDALIARISTANGYEKGDLLPHDYRVREVARQVEIKLIEAKMWAGKMLEGLGNPFPAELADKANVQ
jgi:hypothetical protein